MDGETALKYVRSRHGTNGEASDFARSARQERVITAIRSQVLSFETLTNPQKIGDLVKTLGKSIDTDISLNDGVEFYKLSKNLVKTYSIILNDSILFHPNPSDYGGSYVLVSQDDDFSTIHEYIEKIFKEDAKNEASASARGG